MGKIYEYDNIEFHSLKELAKYVGINEKTLTARLRRKMSLEEACKKQDLRCCYHLDSNDDLEKSIAQVCRDHSKDEALVRNRLKYGYSLNDALNTPKKIARQGKQIVVKGILYNSISEAIRELKLESKESTIRSRLRAGKTSDEAFSF